MQLLSSSQCLYKNTKWQSAKFWSFLSIEPCATSWNNIICGVPSKVLHFPYFLLTVAIFPLLNSQKSFLYVRKSKLPLLSTKPYQPQSRPQFLATNHKITVDFLGNGTNCLVDRKERGVSFIQGSWHGYIIPWCFWGLTKTALDDILGWQMMNMYTLPHSPISKHNKNTLVTGKSSLRKASYLVNTAASVDGLFH